MSDLSILSRVLVEEADAIRLLADHLDPNYQTALDWIVSSGGRLITCGVGKSGHIARKIAGTFSSTGTPSAFLHAAEALHGDLGMVTEQDIVLAYSHSGETDEIIRLFPSLAKIGARSILITGRAESTAARLASLVLDTRVTREACPINLAPTTSTTVMLAVSDALAVAAMERRGFKREDFAVFHPNGALGKRLLLQVKDVMRIGTDNPVVHPETPVFDVLESITKAGAGAACVVDGSGALVGLITDGDIRRHLLRSESWRDSHARNLMSTRFTTLPPDLLAVDALEHFQNHERKIGEMPVVDETHKPVGMLTLKDLLRTGIV